MLQKSGFFMVLVCWLSYHNQAFWLIYVTHDVLLSASFLIPPQSITKEELWTGTVALRRKGEKERILQ